MKYLFVISAVWCLVEGHSVGLGSSASAALTNDSPLTRYTQNGKLAEDVEAAQVVSVPGIPSYSGYVTVSASSNVSLFYWYFPAENASEKAPVIVSLQGPGISSMYRLFIDDGPLKLKGDQLEKREPRLTQNMHMIYVDNPGTGFSPRTKLNYSINEVCDFLHESLVQVGEKFSILSGKEWFLAGEFFNGYVPVLADKIHRENLKAERKINLKGLAIRDGFETYKDMFETADAMEKDHIDASFLHNLEHRRQERNDAGSMLNNYLIDKDVQNRFHVNPMNYNWLTDDNLDLPDKNEWERTAAPYFEKLLDTCRILFYNDKMDPLVFDKSTKQFAEKLNWKGSQKFRMAATTELTFDGKVTGSIKAADNLTVVTVFNIAGNVVPEDQHKFACSMINEFVKTSH